MAKRPVLITQSDGARRAIGFVNDNTFYSVRNEAKHLYRGGKATLDEAKKAGTLFWGLDCLACDGMINAGVTNAVIISNKKTYHCSLQEFKQHTESFVLHHKPHRAQYMLNVTAFNTRPHSTEETYMARTMTAVQGGL